VGLAIAGGRGKPQWLVDPDGHIGKTRPRLALAGLYRGRGISLTNYNSARLILKYERVRSFCPNFDI